MQQSILEELKKAGLTPKEAKIYLAVLEAGQASILEISKLSGLNRTTVYGLLDSMVNKRFLHVSVKGKRQVYLAEPPAGLKLLLKQRVETLEGVLPELLSLAEKSEIKPKLRYFKGIEGIKTVYRNSLAAKEDSIIGFTGFEALVKPSHEIEQFWEHEYISKSKQFKKFGRLVVPDNPIGKRYKAQDQQHYRETKLVPSSQYNFETEILAYDDVVAFISYNTKEKFGLEIQSQPIANTIKMIFEIVWRTGY